MARTAGVDIDEIKAVTSDSDWQAGYFNALELAVLQLTTELVTTRSVSAPVFDDVHNSLGSEATVEVLMVISRYAGLALMLNALDVDIDQTAWLPTIPPTQCHLELHQRCDPATVSMTTKNLVLGCLERNQRQVVAALNGSDPHAGASALTKAGATKRRSMDR